MTKNLSPFPATFALRFFRHFLCLIPALAMVMAGTAQAQTTIQKAAGGTVLNQGTSWTGGTAPTGSQIAQFNITGPQPDTLGMNGTLGATLTWGELQFGSSEGALSITGDSVLATLTLDGVTPTTLASGATNSYGVIGIDMSAATANFSIGSAGLADEQLILGASQTWVVNTGRTITFLGVAPLSMSANNLTIAGGGTVFFNYGNDTTGTAGNPIVNNSTGNYILNGSAMSLIIVQNGVSQAAINPLGTGGLTVAGASFNENEAANTGNQKQTFSSLTVSPGASEFTIGTRTASSGISTGFGSVTRNAGGLADFAANAGATAFAGSNNDYALAIPASGAVLGWATYGANDWLQAKGAATINGAVTYNTDLWSGGDNTTVTTNDSFSGTTGTVRFGQAIGTTITYTSTSGSPTIIVNSNAGLVVGAGVTGTDIAAGTTISSISGTSVTLSSNLTGTLTAATGLTFGTGAHTVTLSGANTITTGGILDNTYSGIFNQTITGGSLTSGNGTDLILINNNISTSGGSLVVNSSITGAIGITAGATTTTTVPGSIQLGGANTFTGPSYIDGGTVILESAGAWGGGSALNFAPNGNVTRVGTFDLNGNSITVGGLTTTQPGLSPTLQDGPATTTISSGTSGTNTIVVSSSASLSVGESVTGTGIPASTTVTAVNGKTITLSNNLTGAASGTLTINAASATLTVNVPGSTTDYYTGTLQNGTGTGVLSLAVTETSGSGGILNLSGTDTFTGGTTVSGGTLQLGVATALGPVTNTLAINGGTLDLDGFSATVGSFSGTGGTVADSATSGTQTLTVGGTNAASSTTFSGVIQAATNGATLAFTKAGSDTLTLAGNNTYVGATTVNGGTLILTGTNSGTGATTVNAGTLTLGAGGSLSNTAVKINGGTLQIGSGSSTSIGTTGATLTLVGGTTLTLQDSAIDTLTVNQAGAGTGPVFTVDSNGSSSAANVKFDLNDTSNDEVVINNGTTAFSGAGGKIFVTDINISAPALASYTLISDPNGGLTTTTNITGGTSGTNTITVASATGLGVGSSVTGTGIPANTTITGIVGTTITLSNTLTGTPSGTLTDDAFSLGSTSIIASGSTYALTLNSTATSVSVTTAVQPVNYYWTGATSSSWSALSNFALDHTGNTAQSANLGSTSNVFLTADPTSSNYNAGNTASQTLDNNYTINSLSFTSTATSSINLGPGTGGNGSANVLTIGASGPFIDVNNTIYNAGVGLVVQAGSAAQTISANVNLGGSQAWEIDSSNPLTMSGVIGDGGSGYSLTKTGAGELILSGVNTYSGGTSVSAGTLQLGVSNALAVAGALTAQGTGTFDMAGHNQTISSLSDGGVSTGTVTTSTGTSNLTISSASASSSTTFSGTISNSGGVLNLNVNETGGSIQTLSGTNSYTGLTTVSSGTVVATSNSALGSGASAGLVVNPGATVDFISTAPSIGSLASSGAGSVALGNAGVTPAATTLTVGGGGGVTTFAGAISDLTGTNAAAIGNLTVVGGNLTLSGTDSFTGTTTVNTGGTLTLASAGALADSTLNPNGGTISFNPSFNTAVTTTITGGALASTTITVSSTTGFLPGMVVTGTGIPYNTTITSISGTTITLSAALTAASSGTLTTQAAIAGLTGSGPLVLTNTSGAAVALTVGGNNVSSTYTGTLSGLGALNKIGTGAITLGGTTSGGGSYSGTTTVLAGTVNIGGASNLTGSLDIATTNGAATVTIQNNAVINAPTGFLDISSVTGNIGNGYGSAGTLVVTGNASVTVGAFNFGGTTAASRVGSSSVTVQGSGQLIVKGDFDLERTEGSTASTNVVNLNGGTLAVNDFAYAGGNGTSQLANIQFNGGTLEALESTTSFLPESWVYLGGTTAVPGTPVTADVDGGGLLVNTNGFNITIAATLFHGSGPAIDGGLTDSGAGILSLTGANQYTGVTTVTGGGTLNINGINALGGANFNSLVLNNGTLQYGAITNGSSDLTSIGAGITLAAGGGTIDTNGVSVTYGKAIGNGGTGGLTVKDSVGTGSLTLTGANSYTGATTINSGTLFLSTGGSLANTAVIVNSGANFTVKGTTTIGTTAGSLTLNAGSNFSILGSAAGLLTVTSNTGSVFTTASGGTAPVLTFEINSSSADELVLAGTGAVSVGAATIDITALSSTSPALSSYTLISDANGGLTPTGSGFVLGNSVVNIDNTNYNLSLTDTGTALTLNVTPQAVVTTDSYWAGSTSGSWSVPGNFTSDSAGTIPQTGSPTSTVNVHETASGTTTITPQTLDGSYSINALIFNSSATSSIILGPGTGSGNALTIYAGGAFSDGTSYLAGTGLVVQTGAAAPTISANIDLFSSQSWEIDSGSTLTVSGAIANGTNGAAGLTKTGAGTLILSGTDTYSGGTTVSVGTLQLGASNVLLATQGLTVNGGTFDLGGNNQTVGSLSDGGIATGTVTNSVSGTLHTLTINSQTGATATTFGGTISGALNLNESGAASGNLTLTNSNTYTGLTTVSSGTLVAANNLALGSSTSATGGLMLNPATGTTATVDFNTATPSIASLASGTSGTSHVVLGNSATPAATTLTVGGGGTATTFAGVISDLTGTNAVAIGNLTVVGGSGATGNLTLSGADTFTGLTTVSSGGTLTLANALALQNSTLNPNGGTVSFGTLTAATVRGLTGNGSLVLTNASSAGVALTIGISGVSSTFTGTLSGLGSLVMNGTGTITLGSTASGGGVIDYAGTTTINEGTVIIGGNSSVGVGGGIDLTGGADGSITGIAATTASNLIVQDNAVINTAGSILIGTDDPTPTAGVINAGASTMTVEGNASVTAGSFAFGNGNRMNPTSVLTVQDSATVTINGTFNLLFITAGTGSGGGVDSTVNVGNSTTGGGTLAVDSIIRTGGGNGSQTTVFNFNGGTLEALASDASQTAAGFFFPVVATTPVDVNTLGAKINTNGYNITIAQPLVHGTGTPDGGLTVSNVITPNAGNTNTGGILTLAGVNTYTGTTTINSGATLQLGDGLTGNDGTITTSAGITDNGTLIYDRFGSLTTPVGITGSGGVTITGPVPGTGSQTFTGANTYTGPTTVGTGVSGTRGTLILGSGGSLTTTAIGINSGGIFDLSGGTLNSTPVAVNSGGIFAATTSGGTLNSTTVTLNTGGILSFGNAAPFTSGNTIAFNGGVLQYNGITTDLTSGVASSISVGAGQSIFIGTNSQNVTFSNALTATSGTGFGLAVQDVNATTPGSLTLAAAQNYTGATTVFSGTLKNGITQALPSTTDLTVSGTGLYDLNGFNQTLDGIAGTSTITDSGAQHTLTVSSSTTNSTFGGTLSNNLALATTGTNTLTLTGTNTYTGGTTIGTGSTISIAAGSALGTGGITISGGSMQFTTSSVFTPPYISLASGGTNTIDAAGTTGNPTVLELGTALTGGGGLNIVSTNLGGTGSGGGTVLLDVASSYSGSTTVTSGTLENNSFAAINNILPTGTDLTVKSAGVLELASSNQTVDSISGSGTIQNTLGFGTGFSTLTVSDSNSALTVGSSTMTTTFAGVLADGNGAATLNFEQAAGTTILTGTNTYFGTTQIDPGATLQLGTGISGQDGTIANSSGITDNGTLAYDVSSSGSSTYGGAISGTGALTMSGAGTKTFGAANSGFTGTTTISSGTLAFLLSGNASSSIVVGTSTGSSAVLDVSQVGGGYQTPGIGEVISGFGTINSGVGAGTPLTINTGDFVNPGTVVSQGTTPASVGTLKVGDITFSGGTLNIDVIGTTSDQLASTGTVTIGGSSTLAFNTTGTTLSGTYTLVMDASESGKFTAVTVNGVNVTGTTTGNDTKLTGALSTYQIDYGTAGEILLDPSGFTNTISFTASNPTFNGHVGVAGLYTLNATVRNNSSSSVNYSITSSSAGVGAISNASSSSLGSGVSANPSPSAAYTIQNAGSNTATLNASTTSAGISITPSANVSYTVTGYNLAQATVTTTQPVIVNTHVGQVNTTTVSVANTAPVNATYTETLDGSAAPTTPGLGIVASGSFSGIAGSGASGTTPVGTVTVGVDGTVLTTAGTYSGTATLAVNSDAVNSSGLGQTALSSQTITVSGGIYNYAAGPTTSPTVTVESHAGVAGSTTVSVANTAPTSSYTETLSSNGFSGTTNANFTTSGSFSNVVAGSSGSVLVGVNGSLTAGTYSGTTTLGLTSVANALNETGLTNTTLTPLTITINANVYNLAAGTVTNTQPITLNAHAGVGATATVNIANTATNSSLTESLDSNGFSGTGGNITTSGSFTGVTAGGTAGTVQVGVGSSAPVGAYSGSTTLSLNSDGTTISGDTLGTTAVAPVTISIQGGVYNLAAANTTQTVNLGNTHINETASNSGVSIANTAPTNATYTETLSSNGFSSFTGTGASGFTASGSFSGVAGGSSGIVTVGETGFSTPGNYSATTTLALNSNAVNGSGLGQTGIPSQVITVTDNVYSGQSTWTTTTSGGTWGTLSTSFGTNWGANQGSPGVDSNFTNTDTATFGAISGQPTEAVTLDTAAPSLLGITFSGGATTSYTISEGSSTNALTLSGSGAIITDTGGTNTIAVPLVLSSNVAAKVSGGGNLIISGNITGAGTFALTSNGTTGTVTLSGSNISTTPFTVNADTLSAVNLASFGSNATVSLSNGGTLQYTGSAATGSAASTMGRNITVGGGTTGVLSNTGSGVETLSGGTVTNNAASTLNFSGGEFVVGEAIGGGSATSNVKVIGGSTVGLTASNTYLGSTSISGGSVLLTSAGALPTSTNSAVILGSGTDTGGQTNTLDLVGTSQTVASITNTGLATNQIISSNGSNGSGNNTPGSGSGASSVTGVLTVNNSSADTYSGSLGGSGSATNFSLTKSGTGALTLSGANTYTGGTTVAAGTLLADAVGATGTGAVTVNSGGVLGGTGTITSTGITVASGGLLNPSGGTGSPSHLTLALNSGSLTMNSGSNLAFVLGSTSSSDEVLVSSGTVALNNQNFSNFAFTTTTGFGTGNYILITDTGSDTNAITGLSGTGLTGSITGGFSGTLTLINSQQTLELVVSSTVPEPSTWALMIGGFAVLMVFQIRRRRS